MTVSTQVCETLKIPHTVGKKKVEHGVPSLVVCYYCCTGVNRLNPIGFFQIAIPMPVTCAIKTSLTNPCKAVGVFVVME